MILKYKVLSFPDKQLVSLVERTTDYIQIDGKQYHYSYSLDAYLEDDPDDDVPF